MVVWYWWWCLHPGGGDPTFFWMDGGKGVLHKWFFRNDTASTKKIRKQWKNLEWLKKSNFPRMCCFLLTTSFASLKLVQRWRPRRLVVTPWQAIELGKNRIRVPQVSALLGRIPSAVGYQPTLATDLASLQASKWFYWNDRFGKKRSGWLLSWIPGAGTDYHHSEGIHHLRPGLIPWSVIES